jgi:hypothetical protein
MHPPIPAGQIRARPELRHAAAHRHSPLRDLGGASASTSGPRSRRSPRPSIWHCCPIPPPAGHYYRSDHFSLAGWAFPPFRSIRAISSRATRRSGAARRPRTTWPTTTTSPPTSTGRLGLPRQRQAGALRLCARLAGQRPAEDRRMAAPAMSSKPRARPAGFSSSPRSSGNSRTGCTPACSGALTGGGCMWGTSGSGGPRAANRLRPAHDVRNRS